MSENRQSSGGQVKGSNPNLYSAIILAAGLSRRMGLFKPMMLLGSKTFLEHVILLYKSVKIKNIFVVTGYKSKDVEYMASRYNIETIHNKQYRQGMFSSVLAGIMRIPNLAKYFFVHPVDIPLVRSHTISQLIGEAETRKKDVIYPFFKNKRGHPPLISTKLKSEIMDWRYSGGLKLCLQNCRFTSVNVPVADQSILMDADTVKGHGKLVLKFHKRDFLTSEECKMLMSQVINTPNEVIKHCKVVAKIASKLAENVNIASKTKLLDIDLVSASALIHDVAKGYIHHDKVGAEILRKMGYQKMGDIVEQHINLTTGKTQLISEAEIVYIADKLVCGENITSLDARFRKKKLEYNKRPLTRKKILSRIENAFMIKNKIENITSQTIENILREI